MKKHLYLSLFLLLLFGCKSNISSPSIETNSWSQMDDIIAQIEVPSFPDKDYLITDYGAVMDGKSDIRDAILKAISACHKAGGGKVIVPSGSGLVNGPIHLKSNVNLHISEGAILNFSTTPKDYLPIVFTRWEGVELMNYSALIYAYEQENIALTGTGVLNGQASNDNWWPWKGKEEYGWEEGMPNQGEATSKPQLIEWNETRTPVVDRIFGEGTYLRPNFVQPYKCKNVLIDGVTLKNSPMWIMHPVLCENVTIQNVKVISHGPNSDGCDPESCKNVLIKNCYFDTGDDCIALKSGRNQDGRELNRPIENVVIQNCRMKDGHGGVVIGSEVSGGARNIFAEDCQMDSPNLDRAIRIKTNKVRGGTIENLYFRNLMVGEVKEAVVKVNMNYTIDTNSKEEFIPVVKNIFIENVNSSKSKYGLLIDGFDESHKAENIQITNCRFDGVKDGNILNHVRDLKLTQVYNNGKLLK